MARKDPGASARQDLTVSGRRWRPVTYGTDFLAADGSSQVSRAIWCGAAGDLAVVNPDDGTTDTIPGIQAGTLLSCQALQVLGPGAGTTIPAASLRYVY